MANDKRLYDIYTVSSRLFVKRGYNQTQISDIARDAGISTGSIYNLFISKKAIFQFVLRCIFEGDVFERDIELPVKEIDTNELKNLIVKNFNLIESNIFPHEAEPETLLPFQDFLSSVYDFIAKFGTGFLIFERNSVSWPELSSIYYERRNKFINKFESYFTAYITKGEIRALEQPEYHARLIIETFSLWGMHIKYDFSDISITAADAKRVALDALIHAYIKNN